MDALQRLDDHLFFAINALTRHPSWLHAPVGLYANFGVVLFAVGLNQRLGQLAAHYPRSALRRIGPLREVFTPADDATSPHPDPEAEAEAA